MTGASLLVTVPGISKRFSSKFLNSLVDREPLLISIFLLLSDLLTFDLCFIKVSVLLFMIDFCSGVFLTGEWEVTFRLWRISFALLVFEADFSGVTF